MAIVSMHVRPLTFLKVFDQSPASTTAQKARKMLPNHSLMMSSVETWGPNVSQGHTLW